MEALPREVFDKIVVFLDDGSYRNFVGLCSLRAASRGLSVLLTPVIFKAVHFWLSPFSLLKANNIAADKDLRVIIPIITCHQLIKKPGRNALSKLSSTRCAFPTNLI